MDIRFGIGSISSYTLWPSSRNSKAFRTSCSRKDYKRQPQKNGDDSNGSDPSFFYVLLIRILNSIHWEFVVVVVVIVSKFEFEAINFYRSLEKQRNLTLWFREYVNRSKGLVSISGFSIRSVIRAENLQILLKRQNTQFEYIFNFCFGGEGGKSKYMSI